MHRSSNRPGLQRLAGAELHARTINNLKEASRQRQEIENRIEVLKVFLEDESQRCDEKADGDLGSSDEK
jgi:hypothetical protein